ncbi:Protein-tyrosine phosphatase catalytic domain-containing protein [Caenorhabditis elegans]|uniref:Protein-tyrosine phosphatase catalytic domain-containing protein n=1 Tax=Caenorhabditis elegans TaxID=6239 RepID=Q3S1L5_CAEEL|nr:Protein-tyrosine phosphatase catalytic domain-containing protein [Caenorhabditis elegans]CCD71337.1 Protein-tyrosine phosphatase catalytic domain-containing protein [Caenorhabditis elegans]|eukprot:NP_001032978.1 Uncharacterized protein CELE_M01A12.4 [Caenorhabditis elegans]
MWIYNVQTVVCLVSPEEAGGYFVPKEGETFTSFQKYQMKTIGIFDEKQGVTVYQCELKSYKAPKKLNRRMIYIICCDTSVGSIRSPRQQTVIMEYMWAFEEANAIENGVALADAKTTVLVHAIAGTRRCASFVATSVMCKQLLEAGNFSAMETWFEMRKRRAHTCTRKHDFFSSIYTFFAFCVQCSAVSETDENYVKSMEVSDFYGNHVSILFIFHIAKTILEKKNQEQKTA